MGGHETGGCAPGPGLKPPLGMVIIIPRFRSCIWQWDRRGGRSSIKGALEMHVPIAGVLFLVLLPTFITHWSHDPLGSYQSVCGKKLVNNME